MKKKDGTSTVFEWLKEILGILAILVGLFLIAAFFLWLGVFFLIGFLSGFENPEQGFWDSLTIAGFIINPFAVFAEFGWVGFGVWLLILSIAVVVVLAFFLRHQ